MVTRIICDSNIHDAVLADANLRHLITQCEAKKLISFETTHVQLSELENIPANRNLGQVKAINAKKIAPSVFVLGYSRLGEDKLGTGQTNAAFAAIQKGNLKHTKDAMIGATALSDADILVTNDRRLRKEFNTLGPNTRAMLSAEFKTYLEQLLATS